MTPGNFRLLNRILALHEWEIVAATPDHELAAIAQEMSAATGEPLYACLDFIVALQATACAQPAAKVA
jgi:hypothetical protein